MAGLRAIGVVLSLALTLCSLALVFSLGQLLPLPGGWAYGVSTAVAIGLCFVAPLWIDHKLTLFARKEDPDAKSMRFSVLGWINLVVVGVAGWLAWDHPNPVLDPVRPVLAKLGLEASSDEPETTAALDPSDIAGPAAASATGAPSGMQTAHVDRSAPRSQKLYPEFDAASRHLHVADLPQPPEDFGYEAPSCALSYQYEANVRMKTLGAPAGFGDSGLAISGRYQARGADGRLLLQEIHHDLGFRRPGGALPTNEMSGVAEVRLSVGQALKEVDGRTSSWAALGSFRGLALFFPTLPTSKKGSWELEFFDQGSGYSELTRGVMSAQREADPAGTEKLIQELKGRSGATVSLHVERRAWLSIEGIAAQLLHVSGSMSQRDADAGVPSEEVELKLSADLEFDGNYVVLSGGRVLHAQVLETVHSEMHLAGGGGRKLPTGGLKQRITTRAFQHLTGNCGGPALPFPKPPEDAAKAALDVYQEFRNAVHGLAAAKPEHFLDRSNWSSLLLTALETHGEGIIGTPEMARDVSESDGMVEFMLTGSDKTRLTQSAHVQMKQRDQTWRISRLCIGPLREMVTNWDSCTVLDLH